VIHFAKSTEKARAALFHQWEADYLKDPHKNRFVYAATNEEVLRLNYNMRLARVEAGHVKGGQLYEGFKGDVVVGVGDRIIFNKTDKTIGVFSGQLGEVLKAEENSLKIKIDSGKVVQLNTKEFNGFNRAKLCRRLPPYFKRALCTQI